MLIKGTSIEAVTNPPSKNFFAYKLLMAIWVGPSMGTGTNLWTKGNSDNSIKMRKNATNMKVKFVAGWGNLQ